MVLIDVQAPPYVAAEVVPDAAAERDAGEDRRRVGVAERRELEPGLLSRRRNADRRQRRQLMADRDAAGLNGAIQRLAQVHAVEDGDAVEVDALGRAGDADERARKRAELDRPHAAVLPALRPRVDLVPGPIARGEELRAQVHPR